MRTKLMFAVLWALAMSQHSGAAEMKCPVANGIARTECLEKNLKAARIELNQVFGKVIARINSKSNDHVPTPERLKWKAEAEAAQQAWKTYSDTECQSIIPYLWWGGSGTGGAVIGCALQKTKARIKELREAYDIE